MLLSIIIPIYNGFQYIENCLISCLTQNIGLEEYEIICVDDGSQDDSAEIVRIIQKKYPNVILIQQKNCGVSTARNVGLTAAAGDYIWFVDADDFISCNILKALKQIIETEECDCLVFENVYTFWEKLSENEKNAYIKGSLNSNSKYNGGVVTTRWIRREFLIDHSIRFHPELCYGEDLVFNFEIELMNPHIIETDLLIYYYRRNINSATSNEANNRKIESDFFGAQLMKGYYDIEAPKSKNSSIINTILMHFLRNAMITLAKSTRDTYKPMLSRFKQAGLFPFRSPKNVLQKNLAITIRSDWIGRLYNRMYMNCTTVFGFYSLRVFIFLRDQCKRRKNDCVIA